MNKSVVNLTDCSTVLYDKFIRDLHSENENLRDDNFWNLYGPHILAKLLERANSRTAPPVCNCHECFLSMRFNPAYSGDTPESIAAWFKNGQEERQSDCIIKKCLVFHAQRLGLVVRETTGWFALLDNIDAHIHIDKSERAWKVCYGARFTLAKLRSSPDLPKLVQLFELLDNEADGTAEFFQIESVADYRQGNGERLVSWAQARFWAQIRVAANEAPRAPEGY
jgi:hypothetical protein